jgi:large subunit ribosomal protein L10e
MAKLRKFSAYQRLERPYTRISKFSKKNYVRGGFPHLKLTKFEMGDPKAAFELTLLLKSKRDINVRQDALEAARMSSNRVLEKTLGKNYYFRIRVYPFHVLRENPLAAGAGADRMSTGMQRSYGKPIGAAARVFEGQTIIELRVDKQHIALAKQALVRASQKLPCACKILTQETVIKH